jgi:hypothetical protein
MFATSCSHHTDALNSSLINESIKKEQKQKTKMPISKKKSGDSLTTSTVSIKFSKAHVERHTDVVR